MTFKFWNTRTDDRVRNSEYNNFALVGQNFVKSGCEITGAGTDMDVDVAAGTIFINGSEVAYAGGSITLSASDVTHDRYDLIGLSSTGVLTKFTGIADGNLLTPTYTAEDYVILAGVIVGNGVTTIATGVIEDIRIINGNSIGTNTTLQSALSFIYASDTEQASTSVTDSANTTVLTNSCKNIIIKNTGTDACYISTTTTATTSDFLLESQESVSLNCGKDGITTIYHVCDTSDSTTIKVLGVY